MTCARDSQKPPGESGEAFEVGEALTVSPPTYPTAPLPRLMGEALTTLLPFQGEGSDGPFLTMAKPKPTANTTRRLEGLRFLYLTRISPGRSPMSWATWARSDQGRSAATGDDTRTWGRLSREESAYTRHQPQQAFADAQMAVKPGIRSSRS